MSLYWEQHLAEIREQLLMMSSLTERNLGQSTRALMGRDDALAHLVEAEDAEVDQLEKTIDEKVVTYISTHGPMARDCRFLITASKIASELERIADQATTIARRARDLNRGPELSILSNVSLMASEVQSMLRQSIKAFVERDTDLALEVIGRDKLVDAEYKDAAREVEASIVADASTTARALHLLTVAKALERAGDHATNIAEEVFFLYKGEDIRHKKGER
ncbi:MAG: phosphate transport system regulatory protein PhoU [Verrucomicrobia bacterium]|nr:phosphate transport system regulatory protein PhoU [Verrucomicrobiota bacterium]